MIEKIGRKEWVALSERVAAGLGAIFEEESPSLAALGQKMASKSLTKLSLSSERSVSDAMAVVALFDRAGRSEVVVASARVLRQVPFTGNVDIYEPIRETTALAFRAEARAGRTGTEFEEMVMFAERGGEPGPWQQTINDAMRSRLEGLLFRGNAREDHSRGSQQAHIYNVCLDAQELGVMWALGGSATWPRARIDDELDACSAALRELQGIV